MAAKSNTSDNNELLCSKLRKLDELGLFNDNRKTPSYIQENIKDTLRLYQDEAHHFNAKTKAKAVKKK